MPTRHSAATSGAGPGRRTSHDRTRPSRVERRLIARLREQGLRVCPRCGKELPLEQFLHSSAGRPLAYCEPCRRDNRLERRQGPQAGERIEASDDAIRDETLAHYGQVCACCGERRSVFLNVDKIDGGGAEERRRAGRAGVNFYRWLKKSGWPAGYQTLCYNCNLGRYLNGGVCPHQQE
jgi:ribosomal protein L32